MKKAYTPELRAKRRAAWRGDKNPMRRPEVAAKIAEMKRTQVISDKQKRQISVALKTLYADPRNHPMYGKEHTEAAKEKISKAKQGQKHSPETRRKMSKARRGSSNPSWKGGVSFEPYGMEFNANLKFRIRQRDDFTCQKCGIIEEESKKQSNRILAIHHIDYNKENNDEDNLIALCISCNAKVNCRRDHWQESFSSRILSA